MPEPTEILEAVLQQEFEHAPYTYISLREPTELGDFEPQVAAAFFEAPAKDGGKWVAYRGFFPIELGIAAENPSVVAEWIRKEIDALYRIDFSSSSGN